MATKVLAPLPGEGVEEIMVTKWLKQEGEAVKESEPLLEANTDKVDIEIPPRHQTQCVTSDDVNFAVFFEEHP
jgi:pyruvate/2-oxoglutarate dehydrogenase complex dihydrolipoamide acyltransferase (E2) component